MSTVLKVPDGMSYVNAFQALFEYAESYNVRPIDWQGPSKEPLPISSLPSPKAVQVFFESLPRGRPRYCVDYVKGIKIDVSFGSFPQLDVTQYNQRYGKEAAEKALAVYQAKGPSQWVDETNSFSFEQLQAEYKASRIG